MSELRTASGDVVQVDLEDVPRLEGKRLYTMRFTWSRTKYAMFVRPGPDGRQQTVMVHRFILDAPAALLVDHRDGDGLNNLRSNLRLATSSQNNANRRPTGATSAFKGVSWDRVNKRWTAHIQVNRRQKNLGRFDDEEEAARVYDRAARELHGEFAYLNFPDETDATA